MPRYLLTYDKDQSQRKKFEKPRRVEVEFESENDETAKIRKTEMEANGHPTASSNLPIPEERTNFHLFREVE